MLVLLTLFTVVVAVLNSIRGDSSTFPDDRGFAAVNEADPIPLLLIDPITQRMELRIANRPVWEAQYEMRNPDRSSAEEFFTTLPETNVPGMSVIESRHLYSGRATFKDRELTVVADEIGVIPEMLQRTFPGRFALVWAGGYVLEVTTGIDASPLSRWDNFCFDVLRFVALPFGERCLHIIMDPAAALTLYNTARPGLPVFICTSAEGL